MPIAFLYYHDQVEILLKLGGIDRLQGMLGICFQNEHIWSYTITGCTSKSILDIIELDVRMC